MSIAVVTDSTADIPRELADRYQIKIVPAILNIDGKSMEDGSGITRREFYERLPTYEKPPTTATPSVGVFEKIFKELIKEGFQKIISIHVSSLLSGITATATLGARAFNDIVTVVDSGQLSLGLGFQVLTAAEAIIEGLPFQQVLAKVENVRQRTRVIAMLDTLEFVRRSGRVSWATARIGSLLRIKPFLEVKDGKVLSLGQARTRQKGIFQLMKFYRGMGIVERLGILHTNAEQDAIQLIKILGDTIPPNPFIVNVTTIVGTHVGPNGLGIAAVIKS